MKRLPILFISHEANRTGAPFVLLHFQRWLKAHVDVEFTTLLRRNGPLVPEFAKLGDTIVLESGLVRFPRWIRNAGRRLGWDRLHRMRRLRALHNRPFELVYSNTITNGLVLDRVTRAGAPVISHVHELTYWIERSGIENWELVRRLTTHFVAASEAVATNLVNRFKIPATQISVVHEFIPIDQIPVRVRVEQGVRIRKALGIITDAFVVGGCGMETWRKGKDLFVQLAAEMRRRCLPRPWHFVWVGGPGDEEDQRRLAHDLAAAGLTDHVHWTGEVSNPLEYFSCFDAFALVSREDPFPLVCLEAGLLGVPILCFANAGGIPELLETDSGYVVDYLDVGGMADKLQLLTEDETLRRRLGACISHKIRARCSLEANAPRLLEVIQRNCKNWP